MKLIIIYGSEASGKLTVAKELTKRTGFCLFHNHVTVDIGRIFFGFETREFRDLVWDLRILTLEHAVKGQIPGVIFTWAYSHPDMLPELDRIKDLAATLNINIHYVYLSCSQNELRRRVIEDSRKVAGKVHTIEGLERQLEIKNHQPIPDSNSLIIDNTSLSPEIVVTKVLDHISLS